MPIIFTTELMTTILTFAPQAKASGSKRTNQKALDYLTSKYTTKL
jgi:hypothetical protein